MNSTRFVWLILIGLIGFAGLTRWQDLSEKPLIMTDGQGYHAYLPAVFIYHDLQFQFVDSINERYYPESKRANYVVSTEQGNVNKYFVGTAIVQSPFFLLGCAMSWAVGVPVDGYSWPFQLMVGVSAIFFLCAGLWFLGGLLGQLGFGRKSVIGSLLLTVFATNLFYYTVYEPSMSHVYSFFTISAFLYFVRKALMQQHGNSLVLAGAALGLTVLIRPVNGMVLLAMPIVTSGLFGTVSGLEAFLQQKKKLMVALSVGLALVLVQLVIYFIQTGAPVVWSYGEEGFNFSSPEIFNALFSYRKGLFVYCPVLLLAVLGMVAGLSRDRGRYAWLIGLLTMVTWVIASWWMWFYGGSFGHRAFIEYFPFFAIGLAHLLHHGWWILRPVSVMVIGSVLICVQLVQTYQYNVNIIPFDNMNKEKYWNLFMRTGEDLAWYYSGYEGEDSYVAIDSVVMVHDMEQPLGWGNEGQLTDGEHHNGGRSAVMLATDEYGITLRKEVSEIPVNFNLIRIGAWVRSDSRTTDLSLVVSLEDSTGHNYYWKKYPLRPQFGGKGQWGQVAALFKCGVPRVPSDRLVVYPMKSDGATVHFDDLGISFIQAR